MRPHPLLVTPYIIFMYYSRSLSKLLFACFLLVVGAVPSLAQEEEAAEPAKTNAVVTKLGDSRLFGYLSMDSTLHSMRDYQQATANLKTLRAKYDAEMKRVEDEFNQKYELFLQEQRDLAPSILQKRQAELQDLMQKNIAFKDKARQLLRQAEHDAYAPLRRRLKAAVRQVGRQRELAFVVNTDGDNAPYIDPDLGIDITADVLRLLK